MKHQLQEEGPKKEDQIELNINNKLYKLRIVFTFIFHFLFCFLYFYQ